MIKTLEQSAITNNSPSLNSESNVYLTYSYWDENWLNQKALLSRNSKSVVVFSEISKEPILGPLSIHQTTKILGVSKENWGNRIWKDKYKLVSQNELSQTTGTE